MFQGIRKNFTLDFLDNKIAEEQEKQKKQQQQPLPGKRPSQRARPNTQDAQPGRAAKDPVSKGPDPDSFVIGDDASDISRAATPSAGYKHVSLNGIVIEPTNPAPKQDAETVSTTTTLVPGAKGKERATDAEPTLPPTEIQLPQEVQEKLLKLEQLTSRYQDLLRNYRTAHAHVAAIEPFEATLREHTPLTSLDSAALVEYLNQQNRQSEMIKDELKRVTGEQTDLRFEISRLEGEATLSAQIIAQLRQYEASTNDLQRKLSTAETERDDAQRVAQSKKGHESAVASLRSQLKRAEKDRDTAYQAIIDCGKCAIPTKAEEQAATPSEKSISTPGARSRHNSDATEASTQPTEVSTPATSAVPSVDGASELAQPGDAKKKKKKKSKSKKKKTPTDTSTSPTSPETPKMNVTLEDMMRNPELASVVMLKAKFGDNPILPLFSSIVGQMKQRSEGESDEYDERQLHLESKIEELQQQMMDNYVILRDRDDQIAQLKAEIVVLQERVTGEAALRDQISELKEECEELKQDILDHGGAAADAKHALKESTERLEKLESERVVQEEAYAKLEKERAEQQQAYEKLEKDRVVQQQAHANLESERVAHQKAVEKLESERVVLQEAYERTCKDLATSESARAKISETCAEATAARDALQADMKRFQDLRDQTHELGMQIKEREDRAESLEEELADAHRLLSERSREGETMRRLLADVETRADSRVKEMRQQMDLATEERDRAEDEASAIGRRKAREIEELKNKLRDAERQTSRASDAKEDAERKLSDYQDRRADLEKQASQAREEVEEIRTAMGQMRKTLDATEHQLGLLEKEKAELRKSLQEQEVKFEKLREACRGMAEDMKNCKLYHPKKTVGGSATPSRTSNDSSRVTSPAPRPSTSSAQSQAVDSVYLKSVLLQFMEQKEKKHQLQLVPVLSQLLHMSKEDEQKWYAAVQAKW
ncbi:Autophagy-related protein 23 [Fulvia fulva]|nr:Autophagy-related protein 23 [Fulvia fulva]KAK4620654.1 Autophagy-related protein 23 [Fulvia fulva]WPV17586.1 Autophagy-related protein 23 [Fulvia fulva]WPV32377.1 Autophagy-related protein 23 [Fulvia fulva]